MQPPRQAHGPLPRPPRSRGCSRCAARSAPARHRRGRSGLSLPHSHAALTACVAGGTYWTPGRRPQLAERVTSFACAPRDAAPHPGWHSLHRAVRCSVPLVTRAHASHGQMSYRRHARARLRSMQPYPAPRACRPGTPGRQHATHALCNFICPRTHAERSGGRLTLHPTQYPVPHTLSARAPAGGPSCGASSSAAAS